MNDNLLVDKSNDNCSSTGDIQFTEANYSVDIDSELFDNDFDNLQFEPINAEEYGLDEDKDIFGYNN